MAFPPATPTNSEPLKPVADCRCNRGISALLGLIVPLRAVRVNCEVAYSTLMGSKSPPALTSLQCRMARAGLRWNVNELAESAGIARNTILRFESEQTAPRPAMLAALRSAFEAAGVEFIGEYGVQIPPTEQR